MAGSDFRPLRDIRAAFLTQGLSRTILNKSSGDPIFALSWLSHFLQTQHLAGRTAPLTY
jgi:hypothetical protein